MKDRTAAKNRAEILTLPFIKRQNRQRLQHIERQMTAIEVQILAHTKADPELGHRSAIFTSIPGLSRLSAFDLLIEMPELGTPEPNRQPAWPAWPR